MLSFVVDLLIIYLNFGQVQSKMKKNPILFLVSAFLLIFSAGCSMFPEEEEVPLPLAGSVWRPVMLDGGEAPAPALESDVRLRFQVDGELSGSTGDNRFFGEYRLRGDGMRIGPLSVTRRLGPNRAYEERFLAVLRLTAFYAIRGRSLSLLDEQRRVLAELRGEPGFPETE